MGNFVSNGTNSMSSSASDADSPPQAAGHYRHAVLRHTLAWVFYGALVGGVVSQLGFVVKRLGGSPALVTALTIAPRGITLFAFLYIPWLEHRPAPFLVAIARGMGCALLLLIAVTSSPLALAVVGIAGAMVLQMSETFYGRLLGQLYPAHLRGRLQILPMVALSIIGALASYTAGHMLDWQSSNYQWVLPCFALAGLVHAVLVLRLPIQGHRPPPDRAGLATCLKVALHDRRFLHWILLYSITTVGFWIAYAAIPVYFADILELSYHQNGTALATFQILFCAGFLLWGSLSDRLGSQAVMALSWSVVGLSLVCMFFGQGFSAAVLGQALFGLGLAGNDITWYMVVLEFAPEDRVDRYMGLYMFFYGVRALLGGLLAGTLMELTPRGSWIALAVAAAVILTGSLLMLCVRYLRKRCPH